MFGLRSFICILLAKGKIVVFTLLMFILFGCATMQEENNSRNHFNSGPVQTEDGVLFSFYKPEAKSVYIAGEFNNWNAGKDNMTKDEKGIWTIILPLSTGKYQYKYFVNGNIWVQDTMNKNKTDDGFGGFNSVIEVKQNVKEVGEKAILPQKDTNKKQEIVQKLKLQTDKNGKINLAVIDLKPNEPVTNSDAIFLSSFIRQEFIRKEKFNTLDKNNMDKILAEQAFQQTGCTTDECIIQMGNILNVNYVLTGNFGKLGDVYLIMVQITEVKTGKIIYSDKEKLNTLDPDLADEVVKILINRFFNTIDF